MRTILASILALLVGVAAVVGLAAWRVDALMHSPEPLQQIAGAETEPGQQLRAAVPELVGDQVRANVSDGVPNELTDVLGTVTERMTSSVTEDERFPQVWDQTLEQTRSDWVSGLQQARQEAEQSGNAIDPEAGIVDLQVGPVATLTVQVIQEEAESALAQLPGGDLFADVPGAVVEQLPDDLGEAEVATGVPDPAEISASDLAFFEHTVGHWPLVLGLAALFFVIAVLLASPGSRWSAWLIVGVVGAVGSYLVRSGVDSFAQSSVEASQGEVAQPIVEPLMAGIQQWVYPQANWLLIGGIVFAAIGLIGLVMSFSRTNPD